MSIVKGSSGLLQVQANLITSAAYTCIVWLKPATTGAGNSGSYFNYINAPGSYIRIWDPFPTGLRHSVDQGESDSIVTTSTDIAGGAWSAVICAGTDARVASIHISGESVNAAGNFGLFDAPSNPTLNIMANSAGSADIPVGDKIGAVAIYSANLSAADRTHLLSGGAFNDLPSNTTPVEYWIDSAGVAKDGSNNLTTWTGQVAGNILTPSGTVTVDDADIAPISSASPAFTLSATPTFGQTSTVTTSDWGATDPTHVDITGPSSNVLTLPLTATATANEYTFTMPTISETEGTTVAGLLAGAGTIRVYTQV